MDESIFNLLKFMREHFGDLGPSILSKEIDSLGFKNKNVFTDNEKEMILNRLMDEFTNLSPSRQNIMRSKLVSLMNFSNKKHSNINDQAAIDFLMGRD
jgi:hypothetical protein